MQRIEVLIEKLKTQFHNKANLSQLLATTQMIQREISGAIKETAVLGTTKIAVVMPYAPSVKHNGAIHEKKNAIDPEYFQLSATNNDEGDEEDVLLQELQHEISKYPIFEEKESKLKVTAGAPASNRKEVAENIDHLLQIPTFSQYVTKLDNGAVTFRKGNDAKEKKHAALLDLTQDIPIKEKENFIQNLFRGDEVMYNRSIKTINNFDNFNEAKFWVIRELKTKLGWLNGIHVELFDQYIQRRFS